MATAGMILSGSGNGVAKASRRRRLRGGFEGAISRWASLVRHGVARRHVVSHRGVNLAAVAPFGRPVLLELVPVNQFALVGEKELWRFAFFEPSANAEHLACLP